jgi:hypothetical protein
VLPIIQTVSEEEQTDYGLLLHMDHIKHHNWYLCCIICT